MKSNDPPPPASAKAGPSPSPEPSRPAPPLGVGGAPHTRRAGSGEGAEGALARSQSDPAATTGQPSFWVFGYGSLMWRPGFSYLEVRPARVAGYHRALCIRSTHYRGTPACPGLVVGLDRGGSCRGRAFLIAEAEVDAVIAYLEGREMINRVYEPRHLKARLDNGRSITVYGFVARRDHQNYAGKLGLEETAALVLQGHGAQGSGLEYLRNTVAHLDALGIRDGALHRALAAAEAEARRAAVDDTA